MDLITANRIEKKESLCYLESVDEKQSTTHDKIRKRIIITRICWCVFIILAALFLFALPPLVESIIAARLSSAGLIDPHLKVRHIGFNKLDIKSLTAGNRNKPDLIIPAISVDFSLPALFGGKVRRVEISGLQLAVDIGKNGPIVRGFKNTKPSGGTDDKKTAIDLPFNDLIIHTAVLELAWQKKNITIPFDFKAARIKDVRDSQGKREDAVSFSGNIHPYGERVSVSGSVNMSSGSGTVTIEAKNTKLHRFFEDIPGLPALFFKANANLKSTIQVKDWKIDQGDVSLWSEALQAVLPGGKATCDLKLDFKIAADIKPRDISLKVRFKSAAGKDVQIALPFDLTAGGENLNSLAFSAADIVLGKPAGAVIKKITGTAALLPDKVSLNGSFSCAAVHNLLPGFLPGVQMKGNSGLTGDFLVELAGEASIFQVKGKGWGRLLLSLPGLDLKLDNLALLYSFSSTAGDYVSAVDVTAKDALLHYEDYTVHAGKIISKNHIQGNKTDAPQVRGELKVRSAGIVGEEWLKAEGFDMDYPYYFPFSQNKNARNKIPPGVFTAQKLQLERLAAGKINGKIKQNEAGVDFSGDIHTPLKELSAAFSGHVKVVAGEPEAALAARIDKTAITTEANPGALHPLLENFKIAGSISAAVDVSLLDGELTSTAALKLEDLDLESTSGKMKCSGIDAEIKMKDLAEFTSGFSQELGFAGIDIAGLSLNSGKIIFRIENPETIFIEEGEFAFCDGKVLINPFRFETGKDEFKISLFCDRIDFDKMVNLIMGKQIAFGNAELNGILPVTISKGIPVFRDAYLYSTPGVGGNLKFTESKQISGGVLLVEEALKDFNYDWIKLELNTNEDKLNITALVKGVPAGKLPLTYDSRQKDIVLDKHGKRRVELKGLSLEIRFKDIALKQLLQGGSKIYSTRKKSGKPSVVKD